MSETPKLEDFDWTGAENANRRLAYTDHYNDWVPAYSMGECDDWYVRTGKDWEWHSSGAASWKYRRNNLTIVRFYDSFSSTSDAVSPQHYKFPGGVEAIDIAKHLSFALGSAVKYCARAGRKPGADAIEDLRKAENFIRIEIERLGAGK